MDADAAVPAGFETLWQKYPWPAEPPTPGAPIVGRNSSGFAALKSAIDRVGKKNPVVMEIGAEFGGSTRKFMSFPDVYVVSVDPWPDGYRGGSFPELGEYLGKPNAMYDLFRTYNFEYRDRLATVREYSPAGPLVVRDAGVEVDVIYIDGDHRYDPVLRDLTIVSALFPTAVITGDDWLLNSSARKYEGISYAVQTAVRRWAGVNNVSVETEGDTWILDPSQPYNLDRVVPRFGKAAAQPGAKSPTNSGNQPNDAISARLTSLEKSVKQLDNSVRSAPTRRVLRRARQLLKGGNN